MQYGLMENTADFSMFSRSNKEYLLCVIDPLSKYDYLILRLKRVKKQYRLLKGYLVLKKDIPNESGYPGGKGVPST